MDPDRWERSSMLPTAHDLTERRGGRSQRGDREGDGRGNEYVFLLETTVRVAGQAMPQTVLLSSAAWRLAQVSAMPSSAAVLARCCILRGPVHAAYPQRLPERKRTASGLERKGKGGRGHQWRVSARESRGSQLQSTKVAAGASAMQDWGGAPSRRVAHASRSRTLSTRRAGLCGEKAPGYNNKPLGLAVELESLLSSIAQAVAREWLTTPASVLCYRRAG